VTAFKGFEVDMKKVGEYNYFD